VDTIALDLSSIAKIDAFVTAYTETYGKLDVLVNNAAMMSSSDHMPLTNVTEVMFVNHFAVVYLSQMLLPVLFATAHPRIVNVASNAHTFASLSLSDIGRVQLAGSSMGLYGASKAANIVHARHWARLFHKCKSTATIFSLHPGVIRTELHRNDVGLQKFGVSILHALIGISPWQGAQNTIHLATTMDPSVLNTSGAYYQWFTPSTTDTVTYDPPAKDVVAADATFMKLTSKILGIKNLETCANLDDMK